MVDSPRAYDIDAKDLEQAFFKLQKTLHPDHYGQKSQVRTTLHASLSFRALSFTSRRTHTTQHATHACSPIARHLPLQLEQDFSRSNSTYLNVAYRTLKDPNLRAKYLVSWVKDGRNEWMNWVLDHAWHDLGPCLTHAQLQLEGVPVLNERSKTADPALLMEILELREQIEEGADLEALRRLVKENRAKMEGVKEELATVYRAKNWPRMVALTNRLQYLSKADWEARERMDQLEEEEDQQHQQHQHQQQQEQRQKSTS